MSDARNEYPRHCRYCWRVIADYTDDHAFLNHGGVCHVCHDSRREQREIVVTDLDDWNSVIPGDESHIVSGEAGLILPVMMQRYSIKAAY